jgi:hypothetical protein
MSSTTPPSAPPDLRTQAHALALRAPGTAWLLGAGASAESAVPTAGHLIDRLLTELYARENNLTVDEVMAGTNWLARVRAAYDGRGGLPSLADVAMYSAVFDRVFPERDVRARWLDQQLDGRVPHFGHHALAGMMAAGAAPLVVTTNFDKLIEDAHERLRLQLGLPGLTMLTPNSSDNADYAMATDKSPLLAKIHGDLGTVTPMNTVDELSVGDGKQRALVRSKLSRYGLIVVGYSGRDPAVMTMLSDVLNHDTPYPNGLLWMRRPEDTLAPEVLELLDAAREAGVRPVEQLVAGNFSDLMTHVRRGIALPDTITGYLRQLTPPPVRRPAARPAPAQPGRYPQLHLCATRIISAPAHARMVDLSSAVSVEQVRGALRHAHAKASVGKVGDRWLAFGRDSDLLQALRDLGAVLIDTVVPLDASDSTVVQGLLAEAAALACGHVRGLTPVLRTNSRHQVRVATPRNDAGPSRAQSLLSNAAGAPVTGTLRVDGLSVPWAEAVTLSLAHVAGAWHLLLTPDIWIRPAGEDAASRAAVRAAGHEFTRERLATRYTSKTGKLLHAWLSLLAPEELPVWDVPHGAGVRATFRLSPTPLASALAPGEPLPVNGGTS